MLKCRFPREALRNALPILLLVAFFGCVFSYLLSTHMLAQKADGLYSGGSTWGDLAWHLSMISNFAERGWVSVRENPIFPGTKLSYPFVPDLISAWLVRSGISLQTSLILPALLSVLGFVVTLYLLARSIGANTFGSVSSIFLVLFNGSIVGILYLWSDYRKAGNLPLATIVLSKSYSYVPERNLQFSNFICDLLLPQRPADFGFCIGTIAIMLLWVYWKDSSRKNLFYAGVLISCLPLIHFHTFLALVIVSGILIIIQLLAERTLWTETVSAWSWFLLPILFIALPQLLWILPDHPGHFLRPSLGWMKGNDSVWRFWFRNLSPHIFVFTLAFMYAQRNVKTFYLAFVGLFVFSNLVSFQPNEYDNLKLMFWWFVMSCILTGVFLDMLLRRLQPVGFLLSFVLVGTMIATGSIAVWRELHLSWRMFSLEDIALAQFVKNHTSADALFLTSDKHNNPISCLAGRSIVMGYRGWLWTHGINYGPREHDVMEMFRGSERAFNLLRQYRVEYVLIERDKTNEFYENPEFFRNHFAIVYRSSDFTLVQVNQ